MSQEKPKFAPLDWEKLAWEKTPYEGVFIFLVDEKSNPSNPKVPKYTVMALKVDPNCSIPLHKHNRESEWTETLTFPKGGWLKTKNDQKPKQIKTKSPFTIIIKAGEIFGLKNTDPLQSLYFFSTMKPGFTGYAEIEEIKTK